MYWLCVFVCVCVCVYIYATITVGQSMSRTEIYKCMWEFINVVFIDS